MRKMFFIRLALLNTFKKKFRAILAITSIALTGAVVIVLCGLQIGLHDLVNNEISSTESKDIVTVNQRNAEQVKLNDAQISKIQSISGVSQVAQSVGLLGNAIYRDTDLSVPVYAVTSDYFQMSPTKISAGSIESLPADTNIIVSSKVLSVFGIKQSDAINKKIQLSATLTSDYASKLSDQSKKIKPQEYTIRGVIDRGELPVVYMPIEQLRTEGLDNVSQLKIKLSTPEKSAAVRDVIEQMGLKTSSIQDTIDQINKLFTVISNVLLIFGVVVFVITVSGVFTIISLTLMEETRQIGFLRITGLRHRDVRMLFITQSIIITFLGAILGAVFGTLAGFVLNGIARAMANGETFTSDISIFAIPAQPIIIILMLSVIIGWLVGVVPAKRAVLINPLEELRS